MSHRVVRGTQSHTQVKVPVAMLGEHKVVMGTVISEKQPQPDL